MATNVFTTHTPVPAGIDTFSPETMLRFFRSMIPQLKLDEEGFLALGREDVTNTKQGFSMALLAIRLADSVNGVSALHGDVSRKMWHNVWPQVPPDEVPIRHITNGIHTRTWLGQEIAFTLDRYLAPEWMTDPADQTRLGWRQPDSRRRTVARPRAQPRPAGQLGAADAEGATRSVAAPATMMSPPPIRCSIPKR